MHKPFDSNSLPNFPPIVSSIGTYNYNLSKYFCELLSLNLLNEFCTKEPFTFVEELKKVSINDKFLVSYDVNSLFSNIPLKETIKLAVGLIKTSNPNLKISSDDLTQLFKFATCETLSLFNGKFYDQIDNVVDNSQYILKTSTNHKSTYSGVLLNYTSFTFRFYKIGLIKCLTDRAYKINNTWPGFHDDASKIKDILKRNSYPPFILEKIIKAYI